MPPWEGELEVLDAESGEMRRVQMDAPARSSTPRPTTQYCREVEYAALRNKGRYMHLTTDVPLQDALFGAVMGTGAVSLQ